MEKPLYQSWLVRIPETYLCLSCNERLENHFYSEWLFQKDTDEEPDSLYIARTCPEKDSFFMFRANPKAKVIYSVDSSFLAEVLEDIQKGVIKCQ